MQLYMVGLSHKTADVEVREAVSIPRVRRENANQALTQQPAIRGAVILSTCNRIEIYVDTEDVQAAHEQICDFIATFNGVKRSLFEKTLYTRSGFEVVRHLFSVVSSLESMVLGEQQITGQVRESFKIGMQAGTCTMLLTRLFGQALSCGKRVRNETGISDNHVSLSTVAIDVAREKFSTFDDKTVLVVGSGEMSELAARYLRELGVKSFIVSSRTFAHACALARELGGDAQPYDNLPRLISHADIIITSTAAPRTIIVPQMFRGCKDHLLILDIALPRDVDPACGDIPGVTLYDLDDLGRIIGLNKRKRQKAADEARIIVEAEAQIFLQWVGEHAVTPTIKRMRLEAEEMRLGEVDHLLRVLSVDLNKKDRDSLDAATRAIVKKLLHKPTVCMKQSVSRNTDFECVEAVRYLFGYTNDMLRQTPCVSDNMIAVSAASPAKQTTCHTTQQAMPPAGSSAASPGMSPTRPYVRSHAWEASGSRASLTREEVLHACRYIEETMKDEEGLPGDEVSLARLYALAMHSAKAKENELD